jgi:hypothetical protein
MEVTKETIINLPDGTIEEAEIVILEHEGELLIRKK